MPQSTMEYRKHPERHGRHLLSIPFIWGMLIPIAILHATLELYQAVCFRLYGIPLVKRSQYISTSRTRLRYLNSVEKFNCWYCGYANGVFRYAGEIAARTELYWCGIKHKEKTVSDKFEHHSNFVPYGDEKAFRKRYN